MPWPDRLMAIAVFLLFAISFIVVVLIFLNQ